MQTLSEIRRLLAGAGLAPRKALGQSFLIDGNLMGKLLELADVAAGETVLEVGPGTGSLTEELLARVARVVAVELDAGLRGLLARRLGDREGLVLIGADVLAGKHAISPEVLAAVGPTCSLVSNLPYSIATPLLAECLLESWRSIQPGCPSPHRFQRMTFTVQQEVADRLSAGAGGRQYGPVSVLVGLLGRVRLGPAVPATAFFPPPRISSRIMRIDFDGAAAADLTSAATLQSVLALAFSQRRKQLASLPRRKEAPFPPAALTAALAAAGIDPTRRPEQIAPEQYLRLANALAG